MDTLRIIQLGIVLKLVLMVHLLNRSIKPVLNIVQLIIMLIQKQTNVFRIVHIGDIMLTTQHGNV